MILIRFKPFSPVLPFLCEKKLKLKQSSLSQKSVFIWQKIIFTRKNLKNFYRTYFNFEGKKTVVKTMLMSPLLPYSRTMYPLLISMVVVFSEASSTVIPVYIGIFVPTNNCIYAICIPLCKKGIFFLDQVKEFQTTDHFQIF